MNFSCNFFNRFEISIKKIYFLIALLPKAAQFNHYAWDDKVDKIVVTYPIRLCYKFPEYSIRGKTRFICNTNLL
jgi:hypothetical protein